MALSYGLSLNNSFVFSIQNQCQLSNQIISVERVNQYMDIPSEAAEVIEENRPSPNWPQVGRVELRDLKVIIYIQTFTCMPYNGTFSYSRF
jgi:ATP-binding cassette, subfamily C (CFTR/MRP), member 2